MSADAVAYVWRYSPFKGNTFVVHQAIADSVNDQHNQEFWLTQERLATKARCTDRTVRDALAALEQDGFLRRVGGGQFRGSAIQFRFIFKRHLTVVYETRKAVDKRSEEIADLPEIVADGSEKSSDRTQDELKPDSSLDNLKVLACEPGLSPAQQIKRNLRGEKAL